MSPTGERTFLFSMETDFFHTVAGMLQGDTFAPYQFIICIYYALRTSVDLCFLLVKARSRRYPARTITDADYADDIALLENTPARDESLLHILERAAGGIGLHVNAGKTEFMCFNQRGDTSTLNGRSLKLGDKFTYSVSSTENDINMRLAKA